MIRPVCAAVFGLLIASTSFAVEPPRITGDEGTSYADLIREQTLVTIMLKAGAPEYNLRIKAIYPKAATPTIAVETTSGEQTAHTFASIESVRVQKGRIRVEDKPDPESVLTTEDKGIVTQATERAMAIFKEHNQSAKMAAASILAASGHPKKADALAYLKDLRGSNDAPTALLAASFLWQNGDVPPDSVLLAGFASGNRNAKALAGQLAGLMNAQQFIVEVRKLVADKSSVEIFPAAAVAAGRLKDGSSLPALLTALSALTDAKAEAAANALILMGGPEVIQKLQEMLPTAKGNDWFRIVRVLYALGDKNAMHLLETQGMSQPAFQRDAALLLAKEGNPDAVKFLRESLKKNMDPDETNLIYRARAALALYTAGDIQQKGVIGDVLNIPATEIYARGHTSDKQFKELTVKRVQADVSRILGESMRRDVLPMLTSPLQSPDPAVALSAAKAIVAISNHEYGKRAVESLK